MNSSSVWKVLFWSVLGFCVPVSLAALAVPFLFENSRAKDSYLNSIGSVVGVSGQSATSGLVEVAPVAPFDGTTEEFIEIPAPAKIEGDAGTLFVRVTLKLDRLPQIGRRARILMKYANADAPYPGWALAINRLQTSARPEVYWQDAQGNGGWFTFNDIAWIEGGTYTLTFVRSEDATLALFVEAPYAESVDNPPGEKSGVPVYRAANNRETNYTGGYDLSGVGSSATDAKLFAVAPTGDKSGAVASIDQILIGTAPEQFRSTYEALKFVSGESEAVRDRLGAAAVSLYLDGFAQNQLQDARNAAGANLS